MPVKMGRTNYVRYFWCLLLFLYPISIDLLLHGHESILVTQHIQIHWDYWRVHFVAFRHNQELSFRAHHR